jgi:hypothetical protein
MVYSIQEQKAARLIRDDQIRKELSDSGLLKKVARILRKNILPPSVTGKLISEKVSPHLEPRSLSKVGPVVAAGAIGAAAIKSASSKTNKAIEDYSKQTLVLGNHIIKGIQNRRNAATRIKKALVPIKPLPKVTLKEMGKVVIK